MRILVIIVLLSYLKTEAQSLAPISLDKFNDAAIVFNDSIHNQLIVSSKGSSKVGNLYIRGIASWNGIKWDSLSGGINTHEKNLMPNNPDGIAGCSVEYNGKLLVGGSFSSMGYVNATGLALWDGTKWDSLPKRAFRFDQRAVVLGLLKKGGLLYIAGQFDTIGGLPANGLATWDGVNFNPIILPVSSTSPSDFHISSIVEFQNEIYICGSLFNIGPNNSAPDVFKFNGTSWVSTTGTGFYGSFDGIGKLIVYNNELYGCGHMTTSTGNPGNNIVKWNGISWQDIGFGNTLSFINIQQMLLYHNQLWVFGVFSKVSNAPASNIAIYDGISWCVLTDTFNNQINSAAIYNDTIYVSGGFTKINSDTNMAYIAKIKYPTLYSQCINVGIKEMMNENENLLIFPNPTNSIINLEDENNKFQSSFITIRNVLGQIVFYTRFYSQLNISNLSEGIYYLTIQDSSNKKTVKLIKQ